MKNVTTVANKEEAMNKEMYDTLKWLSQFALLTDQQEAGGLSKEARLTAINTVRAILAKAEGR